MENINISLTKDASTLVFVDSSLEDLETLCAHLGQDADIHLLSHNENILSQMSHVMSNLTDIKALHLFTHGRSAEIFLGNHGVSLETLPLYGKELLSISNTMNPNGEIYLYGCEIAAGERGAAFVKMFSDLIGLKVAAATHKVGAADLGGSWELDAVPKAMNNALAVSEWRGVLISAAPIDGVYTFSNAVDKINGTYTTADGFFLISAINGELASVDDDLVAADEFGVYINSGGGAYTGTTNTPVGPASPTSYLEIKPATTGSFILNSAVIGEISNDTAVDDSDYTNIYVVGYANGVEVARTATHSSVGTLDAEYNFPVDYFSPFSEKYIDTVRVYFDTPAGDFVDRLTLINMDIAGASTDAAPEIPTVNFNYTVGGDFGTVNSVNGIALETDFGNTNSVPYAGVLFGAGVNDGAFTAVYEIGGSSGISNFDTQTAGKLEYLAVTSYDASISLRQFRVYNDSGSDITLTITGHAQDNVGDSNLTANPALNTTTTVAKANTWTTVDLPADFGEYAGFRIDSGSGNGTVPLYFNGFAIETTPPPPVVFDLNGTDDGNNFTATLTDTSVALADSDADISGATTLMAYVDLTQIKTGDKLILGDPANGGATIELDNITGTGDNPQMVAFGNSQIAVFSDADFDSMLGDGHYIALMIIGQDESTVAQLIKTDMKFSGSEAGDRVFNFLDDNLSLLASATVSVSATPGISNLASTLSFTETELQTAPQLIDSNVTFSWDDTKLTKVDNDTYATLHVNYVYLDTAENLLTDPGNYKNFMVGNNPLAIQSGGDITFINNDGDGVIQYQGNNIAYVMSNNAGMQIRFNEANNPTSAVIEKIIESITLSVNDAPVAESKIRVILEDNSGAFSDPSFINVAVSAENDAPVLSTAVGLKTVNMLVDGYEYAYDVQTLSDGSIIVVGVAFDDPNPDDNTPISNFSVLTKYAADGTLDTGFGTNGVVTIAPAEEFDNPQIVIDSTGKIVVVGIHGYTDSNLNQWDSVKSIGMMRYNDDGSLDTSFAASSNNVATYRLDGSAQFNGNPKVAINASNEIYVSYPYQKDDPQTGNPLTDFAVVKFNNNGVDTTFGDSGVKLIDMATLSYDEVSDIKIDGNGNIVLVGTVEDATTNIQSVGLAIIDTQGNVTKTITSADNDVWSALAPDVTATSVAIQNDGKIVVAGSADWNGLILARYSSTGVLDSDAQTGFGTNGKVALTDIYSAQDIVVHNGKIYVLSDDENMKVVRLNSDGSLDSTFGVNGVATVTSGDYPWGAALKIAEDGTIWIVGGNSADDNTFNIAKLSANGVPDGNFGDKATFTTYGDPVVLDAGISLFDGELSDYDNYDDNGASFVGTTLTLARQGGANANDIFSAAVDSYLEFTDQGDIVFDSTTVGTYTQVDGLLTITFNENAYQDGSDSIPNGVMRNIAYSNADTTIAQPTNISLVWTFNDQNGVNGVFDQGSGSEESTTLVQTLNVAIGEPEAVSSVMLNVANPFTPNDANDTTVITIAAPEGINISNATNSAITGLPKNVKMPLGQFGFTLSGVEDGGTVQMSMNADADFKQFSYFKKNLVTNKWVNIAEGVTINEDGTATVKFSLKDGGEFDSDGLANGTIVDPGGIGENALLPLVLENESTVGTVSLLDQNAVTGELSYAITGGADAEQFVINVSTGLLVFSSETGQNYENPTDLGDTASNNTYSVQVTVTGSTSGNEVQNLIVSILNVAEDGDNANTAPVIVGLRAEAQAVTAGTAAALDDICVVDANSNTMTITLSATNGTIGGLTDADADVTGIQLTGTAITINTALTGATFTAAAAGTANISLSVIDTVSSGTAITTTGVYSLLISAAAPSGGGSSGGGSYTPPTTNTIINDTNLAGTTTTSVTQTVGNNTVTTQSETGTRTFTDASGVVKTQANVTVEAIKIVAPTNAAAGSTTAVPLYWGGEF